MRLKTLFSQEQVVVHGVSPQWGAFLASAAEKLSPPTGDDSENPRLITVTVLAGFRQPRGADWRQTVCFGPPRLSPTACCPFA
jgi:hypothetical protein